MASTVLADLRVHPFKNAFESWECTLFEYVPHTVVRSRGKRSAAVSMVDYHVGARRFNSLASAVDNSDVVSIGG